MCGITGRWGQGDESQVRGMMDKLVHRGPDAAGVFNASIGTLGHRRLSIMDPAGGNQPLYNEDKSLALVANGELYNYPRLREELSDRHHFQTGNDSESALHLYEDLKTAAAEKLDGMFAFALADGEDLYLARDAIGIKPLYVGRRGDDWVFASELKAMVGQAEDVREFPPGTWYHSKLGWHTFYEVPSSHPEDWDEDHAARVLRTTLEEAVGKRLMSDVPVGAFLSGGLDSSIIAAMMRPHIDELHTFTVGFEGSGDLLAARKVAEHLGTIHHEHVLTREEIYEHLPRIIHHLESFDQDLVRSAIPCYFTSRLARQHVKVILTGEGADELFAGYTYYRDLHGDDGLHDELRRSVSTLHNINLQRVDRLTMAHALEARVPFLDTQLIELAQTIPVEVKLKQREDGGLIEKWILRKACADLLPEEIAWRDKLQFDQGSGTVDALGEGLDRFMPEADAEAYTATHDEWSLRSHEECVYHKLLTEAFDDPTPVLNNTARWASRPFENA
jgi:asparagine synthase (glutamine-hydrolysing)